MIQSHTNSAVCRRASGISRRFFFLFLPLFALLFSCASTRGTGGLPVEDDTVPVREGCVPYAVEWSPVREGISYYRYENPELPLIMHLVRVDLSAPGLRLVCYPDVPGIESGAEAGEGRTALVDKFRGMYVSAFVRQNGCAVALNAAPFDGTVRLGPFSRLFSGRRSVGVHVVDGVLLCAPVERYAGLVFCGKGDGLVARVAASQTDAELGGARYAFGAFYCILKDSVPVDGFRVLYDSRTAAGVAEDGTVLYLLAAEGEKREKSAGLSYRECAEIFLSLGCTEALEFDGGSSTSLCVDGKSVLSYRNMVKPGTLFGFEAALGRNDD